MIEFACLGKRGAPESRTEGGPGVQGGSLQEDEGDKAGDAEGSREELQVEAADSWWF